MLKLIKICVKDAKYAYRLVLEKFLMRMKEMMS
jgi:hypothetical protein